MKYNNYNKPIGFDEDSRLGAKPNVKPLSRFPKELVALFAALLVSCAIMFYVAAPMYKEVKIIEAINEIKEKDVGTKRLSLSKIIKISSENEKFKNSEIEKVKSFVPNRNNYEDYLAHFVKLANSKNIKINSFFVSEDENKQEEEQEDKIFNEKKIDINASGSFLNFMSFIQDIEKGVPFIHEESISILEIEESDEDIEINTNPVLDYEICLKFYHY